jgi:tellurite methyltransferase
MASFSESFQGWDDYAEKAKGRPPRELLRRALAFVPARGTAIDLGAGALNDTRFLLDEGFASVTALDSAPIAADIAASLPPDRFRYVISSFEDFDFPVAAYDLVNAQYALPFIHPDHFEAVFARIVASLKPGGILTGQFFGNFDEWAGTPGMTFHSLARARTTLGDLRPLEFEEYDEPDGQTLGGKSKHWHYYDIIARRQGGIEAPEAVASSGLPAVSYSRVGDFLFSVAEPRQKPLAHGLEL